MNAEDQRIAIAKACGIAYPQWGCTNPECAEFGIIAESQVVRSGRSLYCPGSQCGNDLSPIELPDYLNSLDAMHEAEKLLTTREQQADFMRELVQVLNRELRGTPRFIGPSTFDQSHAAAPHRAEAFLRTIGKWFENPA